jgi:hypothetical protein
MKKLQLMRIVKEEVVKILKEQDSPLINALSGGEKPEPESAPAASSNLGINPFLKKQVASYIQNGYKKVAGLGAAGMKPGKMYIQDGSSYSGYVITLKFKNIPGEFIAFTQNGIRGFAKLYGSWEAAAGEVNDWVTTVGGKNIGIGERRPGITDADFVDADLITATIAKTPLLYKR